MVTHIRHFLAAPIFAGDEDKTRAAGLLNTILLAGLAGAALWIVAVPIVAPALANRLVLAELVLPLVLGLLVLMHRGRVRLAGALLVSAIWAILTYAAITSGGVRAPVFSGYIVVVLAAGLLLGRPAATGLAGLSALAGLVMASAEARGVLPLPAAAHTPISFWVVQALTLLLAAVLLSLATRSLDEAFGRARRELAERRRTEEVLREAEARLNGIIRSAMDAIITLDAKQRIVLFNAAAERMFRSSADEVIGQPIDRFIPKRFRAVHREHVHAFGLTGMTTRQMEALGTLSGLRAGGEEFPVEASIAQIDVAGQKYFTVILRDVSERVKAEQALRESEERFRLLVSGVQDYAILMVDPDGRVTSWNAGARRIQGYEANDIIGQPISRFYPPEDVRAGKPELLLTAAAAEGRVADEGWRVRQDGLRFWADVVITALRDDAGRLRGFAEVTRDLSERRRAEALRHRHAELAEVNQRFRELDHLKSKFITDVSHELRTPVANLHLYLNLMERGKPEKREQYMTILKEQLGRLINLVEDITDVSHLELDQLTAAFGTVELNAVVGQAITALHARAEAAGLALTFDPDPNLPPVRGVRDQLHQVVANLLSNALNYTRAGLVRVSTFRSDDRVCLQIQDTGMGIEPEDVPHVFERFYRGQQVSHIPGSGLGLAVVNEIAHLHGGMVEVESRAGEGSTFTVRLPLGLSEETKD